MSLTEEDQAALKRLRRNQNSNVVERAHYVLLCNEGKSIPQIAAHLNRNKHTIRLWIKRYEKEGIHGLTNQKKSGRPAKKAPAIELQLETLLSKSPQDYGYQEAGWQLNLLRDWFIKQGIKACDNTLVKSLNKLGYVYKRFAKTMPVDSPALSEKEARITEIIEAINQFPKEDIELLFVDESHFSNQPYVSRGWFKCGEKKQ
ncbi:MAG: IS630 family transposase [Tatlockia sp.]|nr:IS630 family transposase [Tatlockia sp.]